MGKAREPAQSGILFWNKMMREFAVMVEFNAK
jgi:hypothetical protein